MTAESPLHRPVDAGDGRVFVARHPAELLTGARLRSRDEAGAVAVMRAPRNLSLGGLGMVADIALSQAALGVTPAHRSQLTVSLNLRLLRALAGHEPGVDPGSSTATVTAVARQIGGSAAAQVTQVGVDLDGLRVATGSARILSVDASRQPLPQPVLTQPWQEVRAEGAIDTELHLGEATALDGMIRLTARPTARVQNARPMTHGGVHLRLAEVTMLAALADPRTNSGRQTGPGPQPGPAHAAGVDLPPGSVRLADLSVDYLRPVPADGSATIVLTARVVRRGRRLTLVESAVSSVDGCLLSSATGVFLSPRDLAELA